MCVFCVCVCVCVCVVWVSVSYVCTCVCERERGVAVAKMLIYTVSHSVGTDNRFLSANWWEMLECVKGRGG